MHGFRPFSGHHRNQRVRTVYPISTISLVIECSLPDHRAKVSRDTRVPHISPDRLRPATRRGVRGAPGTPEVDPQEGPLVINGPAREAG